MAVSRIQVPMHPSHLGPDATTEDLVKFEWTLREFLTNNYPGVPAEFIYTVDAAPTVLADDPGEAQEVKDAINRCFEDWLRG